MVVIDDVAEMTKEMWAYLDTVVKGKVMETVEAINLFDEYKKLKAENDRLREENYDLTLTFLLLKEKAATDLKELREATANLLKTIDGLTPMDYFLQPLKEKE